jgi:hypothetical protein
MSSGHNVVDLNVHNHVDHSMLVDASTMHAAAGRATQLHFRVVLASELRVQVTGQQHWLGEFQWQGQSRLVHKPLSFLVGLRFSITWRIDLSLSGLTDIGIRRMAYF